MPETKAQRSEAARKGAATRKAHELEREQEEHQRARQEQIDRTSEFSDEVLKSLESGSQAAINAVRKFVDIVDEALPALPHGERPSRRREIVDGAMDMADQLVKTQYEFLRKVVESAAAAVSRDGEE